MIKNHRRPFNYDKRNDSISSEGRILIMMLNHKRVHSPMLASCKLIPSVARLGRIPRSCEAGGKRPCGV